MHLLMAETFVINQLMIKSKSMMKLEKMQQEKEMITQLVACKIVNILKTIIKSSSAAGLAPFGLY